MDSRAVQGQSQVKHPYYAGVPTSQEQNQLGRDAFLKILIAQLKYQDPLNPMQDHEFIAQTAQFNTLDQLMSLNETMTFYTQFQFEQALGQHAHLIGKQAEWSYIDHDGVELSGSGIVTAVFFRDGELMAELKDGEMIPVWAIHRLQHEEQQQEE